jgi:hypothetical protein
MFDQPRPIHSWASPVLRAKHLVLYVVLSMWLSRASAAFILPSSVGGCHSYVHERPCAAPCRGRVVPYSKVAAPRHRWQSVSMCEASSVGAGALWGGLTAKGVHSATVLWVCDSPWHALSQTCFSSLSRLVVLSDRGLFLHNADKEDGNWP